MHYKYFKVKRDPDGRLRGAMRIDTDKRAIKQVLLSPLRMEITEIGICVNGEYGVNPCAEEVREFTALLTELVYTWEAQQAERAEAGEHE